MTETLVKENNYTISAVVESTKPGRYFESTSSVTRTFNFLSGQVTTITRDCAYDDYNHKSASVATQLFIQNFNDIQSPAEIELMHAKLVEMGGHPPELSEILPARVRKPRPASSPT